MLDMLTTVIGTAHYINTVEGKRIGIYLILKGLFTQSGDASRQNG